MNEKLKKLMEELSKNPELADRMKSMSKNEVIEAAKELNIELTEEDFEIPADHKLSVDELSAVAGGASQACECPFSGDGGGNGLSCSCIAFGGGALDKSSHCTGGGYGNCMCQILGAGNVIENECNAGTNSSAS